MNITEQAFETHRPIIISRIKLFTAHRTRENAIIGWDDLMQEASLWFITTMQTQGLEAALRHRLSLHHALYEAVRLSYPLYIPYYAFAKREQIEFTPMDAVESNVPAVEDDQHMTSNLYARMLYAMLTPAEKDVVDRKLTLEPTTADSYEQFIKLNILPFMGDKPMNEVDVSIVQEFMQWMATAKERGRKKNLNKATITRVCGLLNRMYKIAQAMNLVEDNPVKLQLLRNPGEEAGHHTAASDADVDMVKQKIPSLENEQQRLYAALLVYTGMRKEEVLGLKWSNIHLQERYGEVVQAVTYAGSKKETHIKQPKTAASERVFVIPTALADILKGCQQHDGYIIHGRSLDTPACYSTQKRLYEAAFEALGIKGKYSSHDWRSTFGTQLRESGMSSGNVASLLGHADTRMVETVYARTRRDSVLKQMEAVETLNKNYLNCNMAIL